MESDTEPLLVQTTDNQLDARGKVSDRLKSRAVLILGVIQILIPVMCIVLNIANFFLLSVVSYIFEGIWCGVFFILAGAFGIAAGVKKTYCLIVTCMVLSMFAAVFSIPVIVISCVAAAADPYADWEKYINIDTECCPNYHWYTTTTPSCCPDYYNSLSYQVGREIVDGLSIILGLLECIVATVVASLCCHAIFCRPKQQSTSLLAGHQGIQIQGGQFQNGQMLIIQGSRGHQQAVPINLQPYVYNPQAAGPQMAGIYQTAQHQVQHPVAAVAPPASGNEPIMSNQPPAGYKEDTGAVQDVTAA